MTVKGPDDKSKRQEQQPKAVPTWDLAQCYWLLGSVRNLCRTRCLVTFQAARSVFTRTEAKTRPADSEPHTLSPPFQHNQQSCTSPDCTRSHPCPRSQVTPDLPVLFFCSNLKPFPGRIRLYNSKLWVRIHLFPSIKASSKGQINK